MIFALYKFYFKCRCSGALDINYAFSQKRPGLQARSRGPERANALSINCREGSSEAEERQRGQSSAERDQDQSAAQHRADRSWIHNAWYEKKREDYDL